MATAQRPYKFLAMTPGRLIDPSPNSVRGSDIADKGRIRPAGQLSEVRRRKDSRVKIDGCSDTLEQKESGAARMEGSESAHEI